VALGRVLSEYFGFLCQSSFHQLLHNHPHLSSGAGTIGQKWPQYQVGSSLTPPQETEKTKRCSSLQRHRFNSSEVHMEFDINSENIIARSLSQATASNHSHVFVFTLLLLEERAKPANLLTKWRSLTILAIKCISLLP
jgi:hypothetical protein